MLKSDIIGTPPNPWRKDGPAPANGWRRDGELPADALDKYDLPKQQTVRPDQKRPLNPANSPGTS